MTPRRPQPDILREQSDSGVPSPQASLGAGYDARALSLGPRSYGVALVAIGMGFLLRYFLAPLLDDRAVFIIFLCAVMISAWYGGVKPGLLATALSVLIIFYVFLPPRYTPALALVRDSFVLVLFLAAGVGITLLIAQLHLARQRAEAWAHETAQAEAALRAANAEAERRTQSAEAAERLLHTILDHVPEGIIIAAGPPDFAITANSRHTMALLGRPQADLVDMPAGQHLQAYGLFLADGCTRPIPQQTPLYRTCHTGETIRNEEWVLERSDGQRLTVLVSAVPIRDTAGQITGAISCWRDISAHKRAQQLFERAVEAAPNAMLVIDPEGRIGLVNSYTEQLFGYTRQELVGQRIEALVPERLRHQHARDRDLFMQQLRARPMGAGRDLYGRRKDGSEVPVEIGLNPIETDEGSAVLATVVDMTARRQLAAETVRQQREDQAFAGIAQTLNASLDLGTVLQGVVEAARDLIHSERTLIFVREPDAHTLVSRYQVGYPEMPFAGLRIEPGKGIGGQTLATGRPQRTADYATDPRFSKDYLPYMRAGGRLAVITVPITIGTQVEGVLYVSNPLSRPLTPRDENALMRLATYAATAMHNARLYQQVQAALAQREQAEADLRQAHAVVHEQRERLHITLSSIGDAVLVTDPQGQVTFLNPVAEALTGWPQAEVVGQDNTAVFRIVNEDTRQTAESPVARVIREGTVVGLANHTLLIARDGVARPIDDSAAPIRDAQGHLVGVVLVFRDITQRRQAEAERAQQEAAQRFLAEASTLLAASLEANTQLEHLARLLVPTLGDWCSIDLIQEDGNIHRVAVVHADPAKAALAEQLRQQYPRLAADASHTLVRVMRTGQSWFDPAVSAQRLRAEARDAAHLALEQALGFTAEFVVPLLARGRVLGTITCVLGEGSRRYQRADLALAEDLARRAALALDNARLYAEAQAARAALEQANAYLEQRVEERTTALEQAMAERQRLEREAQRTEHFALLGRLAAGVSHELRNPLSGVFLHVDLLAEELAQPSPESPALLGEYLAEIKTELGRVDDIIQDYLSLVRVHAIQLEVQDLGVAMAAWCREFEEAVAADGVTLQVEGIEQLGAVAFHASTLRRALLNLVQNAAEAMPQGGTVILAGQRMADQVQLQVRDTGIGIPAERLAQIFEPLHTTKAGGTGLGLHIVQEVVAAHGGRVTVQSVEGQHTTFTITLPRAAAA